MTPSHDFGLPDAFVPVVLEYDWLRKKALLDFLDQDMMLPLGFCCELVHLLRFHCAVPGLQWKAEKVSSGMATID